MERMLRNSWAVHGRALATLVFLAVLIAWPTVGNRALAMLLGGFAIAMGAFTYAGATLGSSRAATWPLAASGGTSILFGCVLVMGPLPIAELEYLTASWAIAIGIFELWAASDLRRLIAGELAMGTGAIAALVLGLAVAALARMDVAFGRVPFLLYAAVAGAAWVRLAARLHHQGGVTAG